MKILPLTRSLLATIFLAAGASGASAATLFDNYLERGYSEVAVYARTKALNDRAGVHFARKAADAANGQRVMPDSPADTGRPLPYLVEFYDARTRLMEALAAGAAADNARMAAVAQVNYDCWLAQLSAKPGDPDSSSCRLLFYTALDMITDPGIDDFITVAGPVSAEAAPGDHAAGGNDTADRMPSPWQVGPISALSSVLGAYETAVWIYPAPVVPPPPDAMSGGDSGNDQGVGAQFDGASEDGDDGADQSATGGLGDAVGRTSDSLGGAVSNVGGALGDTVGGVAGAAGGAITGAGSAIGGPVGGVAGTAGNAVSGVGGAVGDAVGGVADAAGRTVSGLGGALGGALGGSGQERPD